MSKFSFLKSSNGWDRKIYILEYCYTLFDGNGIAGQVKHCVLRQLHSMKNGMIHI